MNWAHSLDPRRSRSTIAISAALFFTVMILVPGAPAQGPKGPSPDGMVPVSYAREQLNEAKHFVADRAREWKAQYGHLSGECKETLVAAVGARGGGYRAIELVRGSAWAGMVCLSADGVRSSFYGGAAEALASFLAGFNGQEFVKAADLERINRIMRAWKQRQRELDNLMAQLVGHTADHAVCYEKHASNDPLCEASSKAIDADQASLEKLAKFSLMDALKAETGDCASISLSYNPSKIRLGEEPGEAKATVRYAPPDCQKPKDYLSFEAIGPSLSASVAYITGTVSPFRESGTVTVEAKHGPLRATATVTIGEPLWCTSLRLSYEGAKVHLGNFAQASLIYLPERCVRPGSKTEFSSASPRIASASHEDGEIWGESEGQALITVVHGKLRGETTVTVVNDGPPCTSIEIRYPDDPLILWIGRGLDPTITNPIKPFTPFVHYGPYHCAHPAGKPKYEAITPDLISVDSDQGAVIGLKLGMARVGVSHATLNSVASIEVVALRPCDSISIDYPDRKIPLRATASPKLYYRTHYGDQLHPRDDPTCLPPNGSAEFTTNKPEILQLAPDGTAKGLSVGIARVTVKQDSLEDRWGVAVEVVNGPDCTRLDASYDPPQIAVGETSRLHVEFGPPGCSPPNEPVQIFERIGSAAEITSDGTATGVMQGYSRARVRIPRGPLADATILVTVTGSCKTFNVRADPPTIKVGEEAMLMFTFEPDGCTTERPSESRRWGVGSSDSLVVSSRYDEGSQSFFLIGEAGGNTSISVYSPDGWGATDGSGPYKLGPSVTLAITVEAPPCTGLSVEYKPSHLRWDERFQTYGAAHPVLTYSPRGCIQPNGSARYTSDSANLRVDESGVVTVHAAPENKTFPSAFISVTHGKLTAETKVFVDK